MNISFDHLFDLSRNHSATSQVFRTNHSFKRINYVHFTVRGSFIQMNELKHRGVTEGFKTD